MEFLDNLALGFSVALSPSALLYCLIGVSVGMFIGVLPGIGPIATVGMLLPITFHLRPTEALIMLAGIYYGAMYGGSITSILLRLPGDASSAVTVVEGYPMARQGRAGTALVMTTVASFFGACVAIVLVATLAPPLAQLALRFQSPEYFSLMLVGLIAASVLARGSLLKGLAMAALGLIIGMVGQDRATGFPRFTFGFGELYEGVNFVVVVVAMFGLAEIIHNAGRANHMTVAERVPLRSLVPTLNDLRMSFWPMVRGSGIGVLIGILPGAGPGDQLVHGLRDREADREGPLTLRQWRDRGPGRARGRQQCRRADRVHPDAHARRSGRRDHGDHPRRAHRPRHHAGPEDRHRGAAAVLGAAGELLDRQPDAAGSEPSPDRAVGAAFDHPLPDPVSLHPAVQHHRRPEP